MKENVVKNKNLCLGILCPHYLNLKWQGKDRCLRASLALKD